MSSSADDPQRGVMPAMTARSAPRMRTINICSMVIVTIVSAAMLMVMRNALVAQSQERDLGAIYQRCQNAVEHLQDSSDYLSETAQLFVSTGDKSYLKSYFEEVTLNDRRGNALQDLRAYSDDSDAVNALSDAYNTSDTLSEIECYAFVLAADAYGIEDLPAELDGITLKETDAALSSDEKIKRANDLVNNEEYAKYKQEIRDEAQRSSNLLIENLSKDFEESHARLSHIYESLGIRAALVLCVLFTVILSTNLLLLRPIAKFEKNIRAGERLEPRGAQELRYLVDAYNEMYEINRSRTKSLDFEAHNDALTGLLNRGSFDELLTQHKANSALILVDVDNFKQFNDVHGHEMGDAILVEVAATLHSVFRSSDYICRIGGDEFAVIMTDVDADMTGVIERKIGSATTFLRDTSNGLPSATISVGVAFGTHEVSDSELFRKADSALYEVKRHGRNGLSFAS